MSNNRNSYLQYCAGDKTERVHPDFLMRMIREVLPNSMCDTAQVHARTCKHSIDQFIITTI